MNTSQAEDTVGATSASARAAGAGAGSSSGSQARPPQVGGAASLEPRAGGPAQGLPQVGGASAPQEGGDTADDDKDFEGYAVQEGIGDERGARTLTAPPVVSEAARAHHDLTHLPYEPWCASCVRGRGREARHLRVETRAGLPTVFVDCGFLRNETDTVLLKVLCGADSAYNCFLHPLRAQGTE